jgi:hypothetical protein
VKTAFAEEGDIRSVDILAALVALWREGASGALHFSRSGATAGFQLSAGELTSVTSSESRYETAAILLRAGKLEAATLERLVTPPDTDRALSALHAGILTKREWRWGEKIRAVEVLSDLLTWIEGDYVFDRGAHAEAGEFRLTVPRLILELFLRSRDRGLVLHYLGGADVPLARAAHFESEFAAFGLTADAEAVVRLIDGKATAAHIASEGPAEPFAVEKLLAALVTLGLVHPEFAAPEAGAPVPGPPKPEAPEETPELPEAAFEPAGAPGIDEKDEEPLGAEEEPAAAEEAEASAPYSELDVPAPPPSAEEEAEPRFDEGSDEELGEDLRETEEAAAEAGQPAVGDYEMVEPPEFPEPPRSIAAERTEAHLEYESLHERAPAETAAEPDLPETRPIEAEPRRLPLDFATGVGSSERPRPRSGGRWLWLLVLLAAGVGGVILLRGRGAAPHRAALAETPTPAPVPTGEAAVLSPMTSPVASVPTEAPPAAPAIAAAPSRPAARGAAGTAVAATTIVAPVRVPTAAAPPMTKVPAPPTSKPATPRAAPTAAPQRATAPAAAPEPPGTTRQSWLDRAARDRQKANADRRNHFTIQAELACETQTLVDAWKYDRPAGSLWVLTTPYGGKTCFRVLWGRYPSKEAARRALAGVPSFFSSNHNKPVVTAIR